jgi:hypothetical protein
LSTSAPQVQISTFRFQQSTFFYTNTRDFYMLAMAGGLDFTPLLVFWSWPAWPPATSLSPLDAGVIVTACNTKRSVTGKRMRKGCMNVSCRSWKGRRQYLREVNEQPDGLVQICSTRYAQRYSRIQLSMHGSMHRES